MKSIFQKITGLLSALFIMTNIIQAQAPNMFNYQAVARNSAGVTLPNQSIGIRFTVLDGSSTGTIVYQETQTLTTNSLGLFTAAIGGGTVGTGTIAGVNWASGNKYLKVEIDPTGGTSYTVSGTSQLLSVPYALNAGGGGISGSGTSGSVPVFTGSGSIGNSTITSSGTQVSISALFGPYSGTSLTVGGGLGAGQDSATLYLDNLNPAGVDLFANIKTTGTVAVFQNTGTGSFASFSNGGATPLVNVNSTSNGHGQVTLASDNTSSATLGSINVSTAGVNVAFGNTTVTQTAAGFGASFAPYTDDVCLLGTSAQRWAVVYAANGTISTSDAREKENVQPVQYGLNTLMQLTPVSYNWKKKDLQLGTGINLGFIAQDVEKVLPDVVVHSIHTDAEIASVKKEKGIDMDKDSYGVKYAEFTPVLVKAIQEQQQMITDLQKEVAALKAQLGGK